MFLRWNPLQPFISRIKCRQSIIITPFGVIQDTSTFRGSKSLFWGLLMVDWLYFTHKKQWPQIFWHLRHTFTKCMNVIVEITKYPKQHLQATDGRAFLRTICALLCQISSVMSQQCFFSYWSQIVLVNAMSVTLKFTDLANGKHMCSLSY